MLRPGLSGRKIGRRTRRKNGNFEKAMQTLLLQNQQIIIQQQNMMFMVFKQFQNNFAIPTSSPELQTQQQQSSQQQHQPMQQVAADIGSFLTPAASEQDRPDTIGSYLTPAASEQDKPDNEDYTSLLEGDDHLLSNNLLYNPQTDIGPVTPYKTTLSAQPYYSSDCESLTTPRVEQSQSSTTTTTTNISQNVVKNLADSFKSPTKPKINVQILSNSATRNLKNSKAKIIQRMNISEFLRHVHQSEAQN